MGDLERVIEVNEERIVTEEGIYPNIVRKQYTPESEIIPDTVVAQVKSLSKPKEVQKKKLEEPVNQQPEKNNLDHLSLAP